MAQEEFSIWLLVAGLGVFLYSMYLLEVSVKELGGNYLRNFIKKYTEGTFKPIATGTVVTALLQSSSAVSLMVLAFAGAGLISLTGAIGVIIGSNLGTTVTSWIIAGVGFKLNIEAVSLPFIGLGGLGLAFIKRKNATRKLSGLLFAFGLLLLGLGFMKEATDVLAEDIDITHLGDYNLAFLAVGILLAALMQSSSAAVLIAFSGIYSGIFDWSGATHIVIGTALGTTITVFLGSLSGGTLQKRIAASHFFFNLITVTLAVVLVPLYDYLILIVLGYEEDLIIGLAIFHTLFKLVGVILFSVFLGPYTRFISKVVKERKVVHTRYISKITSEVPEAGIKALKNELVMFQNMSLYFVLKIFNLSVSHGVLPGFTHRHRLEEFKRMEETDRYEYLKDLQAEVYSFAFTIRSHEIKAEEDREVRFQLQALRNFMMSVKKTKDLTTDIRKIQQSPNDSIRDLHFEMQKLVSFVARDLGALVDSELEKSELLQRILNIDQFADRSTNKMLDKINKLVDDRAIPLREQSSLLAVLNEFHQIFIFFLEAIKNMKELDEEKIVQTASKTIEESTGS